MIYCAIGFLTTKEKGLRKGVLYTTIMGLFDSTVGWVITILLEANTGKTNIQPYSFKIFIIGLIIMLIIASLLGLISGGVALLMKKKEAC